MTAVYVYFRAIERNSHRRMQHFYSAYSSDCPRINYFEREFRIGGNLFIFLFFILNSRTGDRFRALFFLRWCLDAEDKVSRSPMNVFSLDASHFDFISNFTHKPPWTPRPIGSDGVRWNAPSTKLRYGFITRDALFVDTRSPFVLPICAIRTNLFSLHSRLANRTKIECFFGHTKRH